MSTIQANYELLDNGHFSIIDLTGRRISGRFSMFVLSRFCKAKGISNYVDLFEKIVSGMAIEDYADLLLFAVQDLHRSDMNKAHWANNIQVMDALDDLGGLSGSMMDALIRHAIERVVKVKPAQPNDQAATETPESVELKKKDSGSNGIAPTSDREPSALV